MLATKVIDRDYLRNRRTHLVNALQSDFRSLMYLQKYLEARGISESESTIADEMVRYIEENKTRQSSINPNQW